MDRSTRYRKIYQDTITRAGIVEGRPLTDYEKGVFAGIIATRERVARLIEEGYGILEYYGRMVCGHGIRENETSEQEKAIGQ